MKKKIVALLLVLIMCMGGGIVGNVAENNKKIRIENFKLLVYSKNENEAILIKNALVNIIYYDKNGKK